MSILVIGDVVTDVVATPQSPLAIGTDTTARIRMRPGGSGANTAAWAAACGAPATLLARVGADSAAWHAEALSAVGARPAFRVVDDAPTAIVLALIAADGERSMITDRGAGAGLSEADWDDDLLTGMTHLHVSGYLLFTAPGRELFGTAVAAARSRGLTTSVDPASTGYLAEFGVDAFTRATDGVDLVFPNLDEARMLTGETDPAAAATDLARRYSMAAVTLGASGALVAADGQIVAHAESDPVSMVDSVGAGDAFTGGFLAARLAGADPATAAAAGCRAGARAVAIVGGRPPGS